MRRHILPILLLVFISFALYANTLNNGFVYDDKYTIIDNALIKDMNNLPLLFSKSYFITAEEMSYRPVVTLTYFIDYAIYGIKPWGYHLTNIIIHTINGILVYFFLLSLFQKSEMTGRNGSRPINTIQTPIFILPLVISFLYVTHPVLSEAVNAVSYREDLLTFLFYMLAFILYLSIKKTSFVPYVISCLFYFLALLSKEMAISFPLIVLCYEYLYGSYKVTLRQRFLTYCNMGYVFVALIYAYLRFSLFQFPTPLETPFWSLTERILTIPWIISSYLHLLIAPTSLSADYVINPVRSIKSIAFIGPLIVIFLCTSFIFFTTKKDRKVIFGGLFFLVTLLPVYNIYPLSIPFAERFLYLPTVGFVIFIASIIHLNYKSLSAKSDSRSAAHLMLLPIVVLIAINSLIVINRNRTWRTEYDLWADTVKKKPSSYRGHFGLGSAYLDQGKFDASINEFMKALEQNPSDAETHLNLGNAYLYQGRLDAAIAEYLIALRLKPDNSAAHFNLGDAYIKQGRLDEAINEYQITLSLTPNNALTHYKLGEAYYKQGKLNEAKQEYLKLKREMGNTHALGLVNSQGWVRELFKAGK